MDSDYDFRSHHFINGKAYTEDHVLVYNISVRNVPMKTTNSEFCEYFKRFGDIVSVHLFRNIKRPSQKMGFVNYKDPQSASIALLKSYHSINEERMWVRACDSWHQPDAKQTADAEGPTNDALVLNLNDDCLYVIFKHLKLKDQISLARCCRRLQDAFVMRAKVEYRILNLQDLYFLTLWQIRLFLQMAGSKIEAIRGRTTRNYFTRVVEFLGIYCLNMKSLSITDARLTAANLWNLLENMHMVEELRLDRADLKDNCIPVLKQLKNLKILSLEQNSKLTGEHIDCLTALESLSLNGCTGILPSLITNICKNLTDLKCLDIKGCSRLNLQDIVIYMHKLETIKLSCNTGSVECIASLPNLKHLHLYNTNIATSQIFVELAKHRADQLESLTVLGRSCINHEKASSIGELRKLKELICPNNYHFDDNCLSKISQLQELEVLNIENCKNFSVNGLLDLIQQCPKLSALNVSNCEHLRIEFATKVLQLLISEKEQRDQKEPLKIMAYYSGIPRSVVNTTAFKCATDLLSISFGNQSRDMYEVDSDTDICDWDYPICSRDVDFGGYSSYF